MGKHADKLGKFEEFQAPWESSTGTDQEIDPAKLKKYLFNVLSDKAKAEDAADEAAEKVAGVEKELENAKAEVAKGDPSGKIAQLEKDLAKAKDEASKATVEKLRLEVGSEKGLTPKQAARLQGSTKEELEADADEILETFGVKPAQEDDEEEDEDDEVDEVDPRTSPVTKRLTNPADSGGDGQELDYEKIVSGFNPRVI